MAARVHFFRVLMLKVSETGTPNDVVFEVEGSLAGPWVSELERCWHDGQARSGAQTSLSVRLRSVTFIDDAGQDLLARMFRSGVRLEGAGCLVRAILGEITNGERGA